MTIITCSKRRSCTRVAVSYTCCHMVIFKNDVLSFFFFFLLSIWEKVHISLRRQTSAPSVCHLLRYYSILLTVNIEWLWGELFMLPFRLNLWSTSKSEKCESVAWNMQRSQLLATVNRECLLIIFMYLENPDICAALMFTYTTSQPSVSDLLSVNVSWEVMIRSP